jgi:sugar phosphate permease
MGVLSLGFVFGGICATLLAGGIAKWSGDNWRWIMTGPSLALAVILVLCWMVLPREQLRPAAGETRKSAGAGFQLQHIVELLQVRQFWIVCALSFTLTLLRETFNVWTVDFFQTTAGGTMSSQIAAFLSTPFDAVGAVGILLLGWIFGRIGKRARMALVFTILTLLAVLVLVLPALGSRSPWLGMTAVGGIGFLVYGPYSLLAGVLSVEIRGKEYVATVAGMVDGTGYLAAILAGAAFGHILDVGGYRLGFTCLAGLALISAVLSLFLYSWRPEQDRPTE